MTRSIAILASFITTLAATTPAGAALVNRWRLDEATGNKAAPAAGLTWGVLGSSAHFAPALLGNGVKISPASYTDGTSYVDFSGAGKLGAGEFTILFWVQTNYSAPGTVVDLVGNRGTVGHGNFVSLRMRGDGTVTGEIDQDASGVLYGLVDSGGIKINDGKWHQVAMSRDLAGINLFIDGARTAARPCIPVVLSGSSPFRIGRTLPGSVQNVVSVPMLVDDLNVYNTSLAPGDIRDVFFETGGNLSMTDALARMYAPELRFDQQARGLPMSAQAFYDLVIATGLWAGPHQSISNMNLDAVQSGLVPVYYDVTSCGASQVRINYWFFYGYQQPCFVEPVTGTPHGDHNGDWEHIMVTLSSDGQNLAAVTYYQHEGEYTRLAGAFDLSEDTHPVVRVGRIAHGSYHNQGGDDSLPGVQCMYYNDLRHDGPLMRTWRNLISLDSNERWMIADQSVNFTWGYDGISTHPTRKPPSCNADSCEGQDAFGTNGCAASMCRTGDVATVNAGNGDLACTGLWGPLTLRAYSLPTSDVGLLFAPLP